MKYATSLLFLIAVCAGGTLAAAEPSGEKWKVSATMQMAGMSMPSATSEICTQPGGNAVPMKTEKGCELYDVSRVGSTQSFKMRCTGRTAMSGSGQLTYTGTDRYQGKMQVSAQGQTMSTVIEGQKLGVCDGGELNLKAKQVTAQATQPFAVANPNQAQMCRQSAAEATSPALFASMCKDPADIKTYCTAVQTPEKFQTLAATEQANVRSGVSAAIPGMRPLSESAKLCGFNIEQLRAQLCTTAESAGRLGFLTTQCPAQATALAKAQCAGRSYTSISSKYRDFCSAYLNGRR